MRVLTITCDRCKKAVEPSGIFLVRLYVGPDNPHNYNAFKGAEWCRECCISVLGVGWKPEKDSPAKPPDPPPSLEDMIREIATEAAIDAVRSR